MKPEQFLEWINNTPYLNTESSTPSGSRCDDSNSTKGMEDKDRNEEDFVHDKNSPDEGGDSYAPAFSEDALALIFTKRHAADWRYVADWGRWLKWDGRCWRKETTLRVFELARLVCRAEALGRREGSAAKLASASTVAAVERLVRSDRRHAASSDIWDQDLWLLNTPGGIVNLRSGDVSPCRQNAYMTKITSGNGAQYGRPNQWFNFLNDVTNGDADLQAYLARVAGYALTGVTSEQALFFFYGTGSNGKSVFLNTLAAVIGDYAVNSPMDTFMETRSDRHPTDLAGLRGARLVTASEVENGRRWAESKIKSLTGGDRISARLMRQDFFEFLPQFKLLIAGNHKPKLRDVDEAMRRRLHMIPFTVTIPKHKRDKNLVEKLMAEKDFILQWAIAGCLDWQERGLTPPPCVLSATEDYFASEDTVGRWMDEHCMKSEFATAKSCDLFDSWKDWAERSGEFVGTSRQFLDRIAQHGFERWREPGTGRMGFIGIGLKK